MSKNKSEKPVFDSYEFDEIFTEPHVIIYKLMIENQIIPRRLK